MEKNNNEGVTRTYHHKNTPSRSYAYKVSYAKNKDNVQLKAYGTEYKGDVNNIEQAGKGLIKCLGFGAFIYWGCKTAYNIITNKKKTKDQIEIENVKKDNQMAVLDHKIDKEKELIDYRRNPSENVITNTSIQPEGHPKVSAREWIKRFDECYPMPKLKGDLEELIKCTPKGFKTPMLLTLLASYCALCFSKVRGIRKKDQTVAPNMTVVIEGESGSGKSKFGDMYKMLFDYVIESDHKKIENIDTSDNIIQIVGDNITEASLFQVGSHSKGLHLFTYVPEISLLRNMKGINYEYLRLATDNDYISHHTKDSSNTGSHKVYHNLVLTGTTAAVERFIPEREEEGGTASRIFWSLIPELGKDIPELVMPDKKTLKHIKGNIKTFREKYCYKTNGKDIACKEYKTDMQYVNDALNKWLDRQHEIYENDHCAKRNQFRARIATLVLQAVIPVHMMYEEPKDAETRKMVVDLAIYLANYCMERYLYKFAGVNEITADADIDYTVQAERVFSDDDFKEWYEMHESGLSYNTIETAVGAKPGTARNKIDKYKREHHIVDQNKKTPKVHEPNKAA